MHGLTGWLTGCVNIIEKWNDRGSSDPRQGPVIISFMKQIYILRGYFWGNGSFRLSLFEEYGSIMATSIPKRINVFTVDVYWLCIYHYKPFKETCCRSTVPGVILSHSLRPTDVWSCCTAAAAPAGPDGRPIHTYRKRHLWSLGDLIPAGAQVSKSVSCSK